MLSFSVTQARHYCDVNLGPFLADMTTLRTRIAIEYLDLKFRMPRCRQIGFHHHQKYPNSGVDGA